MEGYTIFLEKGNTILKMPTNPEEIKFEEPQDFEDYDIIKLGPITVPGALGLRTYSFEVELPSQVNSYVVDPEAFKTPDVYISTLRSWRAEGKPIGFIISSSTLVLAETVVITSLDYTEKAGEEGSYYMGVKFKQYKPFDIEFNISEEAMGRNTINKAKTTRPSKPPMPAAGIHVIQEGDSLWKLAKKYLGSGDRYKEIMEANQEAISHPNMLRMGQKLIIPGGE